MREQEGVEQNPINVDQIIPDQNQPATPPVQDEPAVQNEQVRDPVEALQGLIASVVANANEIIPRFVGT